MVAPVVDSSADPSAGAPVWFAPITPFREVVTALPDPVPCGAGCATAELGGVALTAWDELLPRSACGAKPVLTVDDFSTVVLSGSDVMWETAAGVTGVVVTGWLVTALPVVAAGTFADVVTAFTGWFSGGENDGDSPADPLGERPEAPEENVAAEYGADVAGCTDIE